MVNFGGWDMPVEYPSSGGLIAEHKAVRGNVGVFDVSHMGDIRIRSGKKPGGALEAVQHITMNDASRLAIGQAQYSAMLYGRDVCRRRDRASAGRSEENTSELQSRLNTACPLSR